MNACELRDLLAEFTPSNSVIIELLSVLTYVIWAIASCQLL